MKKCENDKTSYFKMSFADVIWIQVKADLNVAAIGSGRHVMIDNNYWEVSHIRQEYNSFQ